MARSGTGPGDQVGTSADVDGDGVANPVTLHEVATGTQLLRVGLADGFADARIGGDDAVRQSGGLCSDRLIPTRRPA
jgi:hypothetical protein